MTVAEAIQYADEIAPNQYTQAQKTRWLADLDGKTLREVFMTHEKPGGGIWPVGETDGADELLIPAPYANDVYVNYLLSRIAEANAEVGKYNLYAALFNMAYQDFANRYNRTHEPKGAGVWRF